MSRSPHPIPGPVLAFKVFSNPLTCGAGLACVVLHERNSCLASALALLSSFCNSKCVPSLVDACDENDGSEVEVSSCPACCSLTGCPMLQDADKQTQRVRTGPMLLAAGFL